MTRRSTLGSLFHYASASAVENFTTEAFAAAIRSDPGPLVRSLSLVDVKFAADRVEVHTQVSTDAGILDLLVTENGEPSIVIEVKVNAGQSGDQLVRYLEWTKSFTERPPRLVVLSPHQITSDDAVTWLPWQSVWRELRSGESNLYWTDLARWLEECEMADDSYEPIAESEVAALDNAHSLLKKAARILTPVAVHMNEVWRGSNWPHDNHRVTKQIILRFQRWPSYSIHHRKWRRRCGVAIGIFHEDGNGSLGVWVWALAKRVDERSRIHDLASNLPPGWHRDAASSEMLGAYRPLSEFSTAAKASEWLTARTNELAAVGMFKLIEGFRGDSLNDGDQDLAPDAADDNDED